MTCRFTHYAISMVCTSHLPCSGDFVVVSPPAGQGDPSADDSRTERRLRSIADIRTADLTCALRTHMVAAAMQARSLG
jgi:hypothetical protein